MQCGDDKMTSVTFVNVFQLVFVAMLRKCNQLARNEHKYVVY